MRDKKQGSFIKQGNAANPQLAERFNVSRPHHPQPHQHHQPRTATNFCTAA